MRVEAAGPLKLFQAVSQAEAGVPQGPPCNAYVIVLVSKTICLLGPFNERDRVIDAEFQDFHQHCHESSNARGADEGQGRRIGHLSPKHHEAGNSEAVVRVEVRQTDDVETPHAEPHSLPCQLGPFAGVKKIDASVQPYSETGEEALRHGHHTAGSEQDAFHGLTPLAMDWREGGFGFESWG
jgi:hypothetical protein